MPRLSRMSQRGYQFLCRHIVFILVLLLCLGLGIGLAGSYHLSLQLVESQAQHYASVTANTLNLTRTIYSENVVQALTAVEGVTVSAEYHEIPGGIPNPATFSIELAERLSDRKQGSIVKLYSDYPFPNRRSTGGPQDDFEREALAYLRQNPYASFYRKEKLGDRLTFRYAEAVRLKPSCVACHNTLPSSPKRDWQVGEVRGVVAITQPLDSILLIAQQGLRNIYAILIVIMVLAMMGLSLVIGKFRLINVELEEKVEARTAELNRLANLDGLTQIANRRHFDQTLDEEWRRAGRNQQPLSLMLCDVDFFKQYNDTYGHQAGDDCLRAVAQALKSSAQRAGETVARYGGEEFGIILPNINSDDAVKLALLIRKRLAGFQISHATSQVDSFVTISIGIATLVPATGQCWEGLVEGADQALYEAKKLGRDRHAIWTSGALAVRQ
jgi:diguanylate cyclase (GGDEF)-like protein